MRSRLFLSIVAVLGFTFGLQASAATILSGSVGPTGSAQGLTYTLTGTQVTSSSWNFLLTITGANSASDLEGGRTMLKDLAFNLLPGFISTVPVSLEGAGLDANGCKIDQDNANFFCFNDINVTVGNPMSFGFVLNATGVDATWDPDLKVDWAGTRNNYDRVSQKVDLRLVCTGPDCCNGGPGCGQEAPEPGTLALLGAGLTGLALLRRRRRA